MEREVFDSFLSLVEEMLFCPYFGWPAPRGCDFGILDVLGSRSGTTLYLCMLLTTSHQDTGSEVEGEWRGKLSREGQRAWNHETPIIPTH